MPAHACTDPVQHFRTQHRDTSYVKHTPPRQQQQQRQQQTFTARWMYRSTPTQHIRTAQLYSSISRRQHLVQTAAVLPVPLLTAGRPILMLPLIDLSVTSAFARVISHVCGLCGAQEIS